MQGQASGQDQQVLIVVLPEPINDLRHQLQHTARTLKSIDGSPVVIKPVENLGMNGVSLHEAVEISPFLRFGGQLRAFGHIGIGKGATYRIAGFRIAHRLEQSSAYDFKSFFRGDRLPQCLDASEGFFKGPQGGNPALASGLDIRFRQRRQHYRRGHKLGRFG